VRSQRGLAAVRELWTVRDHIAQRRDIAPGRILPDSAIVSAAMADPATVDDLIALPVFGGRKQRRSANTWFAALVAARTNPEPTDALETPNGPPPAVRWSRRKPEAAARLDAARAGLAELSEHWSVPAENLVTPELVRRLCWDWTERRVTAEVAPLVDELLRDGGARVWQRKLVVPVLAAALESAGESATGAEIDASAEKVE